MPQALRISALAKSVGVTAKTLRYWERIGLLPRANRTHTGYRIFAPEVMCYIDFILKAKTVGLTLSEMRRVIEVAHGIHAPRWCNGLMTLMTKTKHLRGKFSRSVPCDKGCGGFATFARQTMLTCAREKEPCCLIEDLPNSRLIKGNGDEKTVLACASAVGRPRS
jgi:DNA-binding transcriptional MerR regulator